MLSGSKFADTVAWFRSFRIADLWANIPGQTALAGYQEGEFDGFGNLSKDENWRGTIQLARTSVVPVTGANRMFR